MVERARLESVYTSKGYRGFESLPLRLRPPQRPSADKVRQKLRRRPARRSELRRMKSAGELIRFDKFENLSNLYGEMSERFNVPDSKSGVL